MRLANHRSIKELLAALPDGTLRPDDLTFLTITRSYIHALREYTVIDAAIFTGETRLSLAMEITSALAELLESRVPKRSVGRPSAPLKAEIAAFKDALAVMLLIIDNQWDQPAPRTYRAPTRAALDSAFTALLKEAQRLQIDTESLTDAWSRLCDGIKWCAEIISVESPSMAKSTVVAQMHLVLKILLRDAQGARA